MKRKVSRLRPSPNEEARIIREEHERRRKLRIQQVRDQQRCIALQIRREVEHRRQHELRQLEQQLRENWEQQQNEKLQTLLNLYQESLQLLGQGHRSAKENEHDLAAVAQKEEENHAKAEERYREALKELKTQKIKDHERQNQFINARKKALQTEKERSAKVASLPSPCANPVQKIDIKKPRTVKRSDISAFATTYYHMLASTVQRETQTVQPNAHEEAQLEMKRLQDLQREEKRRKEEQLEKARLRGRQALKREQLVQDRDRLLVELEHMQQTDLLRRRQQVSQMPPQIFQPLYKRQEMREDFQREMEFAFEDMYTGERRVKGDLVVQLVPEPLPASSTGSRDQELDVSLDENVIPETENMENDLEQEVGVTEQETSAKVEPWKPAPKRALRKLLDRIRSQRNEWINSSCTSAPDSPIIFTDQVPEQDTTIESGSLPSEEKVRQTSIDIHEPIIPPSATEPTDQPDTSPDILVSRIQEFEDERKKKEIELEKEKHQQLFLLQELEEQKAQLEQMLLEAQEERERLKAAVTQEVPEVHVQDPEDTPSLTTELTPPTGEDDHARRIQEYQQQLLEQNRIHQRSVEVARQRLEEYQRALQIRHNMTARSMLSAVRPPGFVQLLLHDTQSDHFLAPLHPLTTPAGPPYIYNKPQISLEAASKDSNMLASPPPAPTGSVVESVSKPLRIQTPDVTVHLTDSIMKRVTEHLPERLRPSSVSKEQLPYKLLTHESTSSQAASGLIPNTSTGISGGSHLDPGLQSVSLVSGHEDVGMWRRELEEAQKRVIEKREAVMQQQRLQEEQEQRRQLEEEQRWVMEQREAVMQQQRLQEEQERRRQLEEEQRWVMEQREAVMQQQRLQEEQERRRQLEEEQRWVMEQREAVMQQQEEERRRREVEMEHMRRQKETLQALINTDDQHVSDTSSEVSESEDTSQKRLRLLVSLLKAIEESNGGSLSHLENPEARGDDLQHTQSDTAPAVASSSPALQTSVFSSGLLYPPRALKPPVTRVKLGFREMTEQHELSAIQEVETPVNMSQVSGPEDKVSVLSHTDYKDLSDNSKSFVSDGALQTPSVSSSGQQGQINLKTSSHLPWRERLLLGAGSSPECSQSDSILPETLSPLSSDSGRGADFSGPANTSYKSPAEPLHSPPHSDCLSSTTISSGSYVTTDPEQNINTVKSLSFKQTAGDLSDISSPRGQTLSMEENSAAGRPSPSADSVFSDSSIQRIIDKYTRELDISLSTAGSPTGGRMEDGNSAGCESVQSPAAGAQTSFQDSDNTVSPGLGYFSGEDLSQDRVSFQPLIGHLTDQSSCLVADQRDSTLKQLVGQPSAHSSVIGHLPGLPVSLSFDQGGWDATLSQMMGRLSHHSSAHWLSPGRDFTAGRFLSESLWLNETSAEGQMRPLVGELDESADQHSGSSSQGEGSRIVQSVSPEDGGLSHRMSPPEPSSHNTPVPDVNPLLQDQIQQNQTSPVNLDTQRGEEDSFHPLPTEITHNETADLSMTFHLPEHSLSNIPEGHSGDEEQNVSTRSVEFEVSVEQLRTEEPNCCGAPSLHESFSQLLISEIHPQESGHIVSPSLKTDEKQHSSILSHLTTCDDAPAQGTLQLETNMHQDLDPVSECSTKPKSDQDQNQSVSSPASDKLLEAADKGILEQSAITLVSLTDSTQDEETTITEEVGEENVSEVIKDEQESQEIEGLKSTLLQEENPEEVCWTDPVTVLEFQWGPSKDMQDVFQQKRTALLQKSNRRVEELKAKGARTTSQAENVRFTGRDSDKANQVLPVTCKTKTTSEPEERTSNEAKGKRAVLKNSQLPPPVSDSRLSKLQEVKLCTPEQRKQNLSDMHRRTQRLYQQLEEVKQQKAIRSRQEDYAKNRLKAKEFHKKTLQKLRAKQNR